MFGDIDDDLGWFRLSLKCVEMKVGSVIMEFKDFETQLNRIKDFTGRPPRMSTTTSFGTRSRIA